jgi:alpha-beta hydrolase superfamily lysophospholipase
MTATLATDDGLDLFLHDWPRSAPRGTVLLVHGLGEHAGRYAHVAARLNAWGWRVMAHDHRGHGRSGGARGRIADGDALLRDLARVIDAARAEQPGPLLLLGHSMGGLIAARFVAEGLRPQPAAWHREVDGLVLSSPALAVEMNAFQRLLLATLGPLAPNLAVANGLDPAWVSRDPAVVAAYVADPLVHDRITPRLTRFIVDGGEFVRGLAPRWCVPTLLMWAGSDRCVAPSGSAEFAAAAPKDVLQSQVFEPLFHEILNEPEQAQVFARLQAWLQRWA